MADRIPGYDFTVKRKTPENQEYVCLICHLLLRESTELPNCHHVFCNQCLIKWEDQKIKENGNERLKCSLCQEPYQREQKHSNRPFDRLITTSLDVLCKQHEIGCKWYGKIIDYQNHFRVCRFVMTECRFEGCDLSFLRRDQQHHELECEHRLVQCELCGVDQKVCEMEQHHQEICPDFKVNCPNSGCDLHLKRKEVVAHFDDCLYEKVSCDFHDVGCNVTVLKHEVEEHNALYNNQHLKLVLHKCLQTDQELKKTTDKLTITQAQLGNTKAKLEICMAEKNELNKKLTKLDESNDEYFKNCFSVIERSTKVISQYLLEIKEVINHENIVKQGEPFNSILPLLEEQSCKIFEEKFLVPPIQKVMEHKGDKYNFDDLNKINIELFFIPKYQQQRQQQQYEEKMEFINKSMEQGKFYRRHGGFFFKLKVDFELHLNFQLDLNIQRYKQYFNHYIIFSNTDLLFFKSIDNYIHILVNMEGFNNNNSNVYLIPYKQGYKNMIQINTYRFPVREYYKSPMKEVMFCVKKK